MPDKVLWIEDNALADLQEFLGPVFVDGRYDLVLALDASEGIYELCHSGVEYAAVIVDIRIPPGKTEEWRKLYIEYGGNNISARLGLEVLHTVLRKQAKIPMQDRDIPEWARQPERFAVFTVESKQQIEQDLAELNVRIFRQKTNATSPTILLDLIEEVKKQVKPRE